MNIRFVSSLTPDDEDQFAPALLTAISALLDHCPIAYTIRIETVRVIFQHSHPPMGAHGNGGPSAASEQESSGAPGSAIKPGGAIKSSS